MNLPNAKDRAEYQVALDFLYDRINYEKTSDRPYNRQNFRLSRMERLLVELGNPQQSAPVIHVAGSKGKGSVAWLMAESLRRSGYATGLYTSPHIIDLEERFVVNGSSITPEELIQAVRAIGPAAERIASEGHGNSTFFELTTAIAWWIFRHKRVDVSIVEVGLGGRLDSTNVCWPALSIITSISFDHQQQLGETLAEIAFEKAGIIKPGVPVISGAIHPEASAVIQRVAKERGCMLKELNRDFFVDHSWSNPDSKQQEVPRSTTHKQPHATAPTYQGLTFNYRPTESWISGQQRQGLAMKLLGRHQACNASLVLAAIDILVEQRWNISEAAIEQALAETAIPGRVQTVSIDPLVIVDAAHNEASIAALVATLEEEFPHRPRIAVFSASRDKKYAELLKLILPFFDEVVLTQFQSNPRATPVDLLSSIAEDVANEIALKPADERQSHAAIHSFESPQDAYEFARKRTGKNGLLCVTGSFFLVAELLPMIGR